MMAAREGLLIDSDMRHRFGLAPLQAAIYGTFLNGVHFVPTEFETLGDGLLAGGRQPVYCETLKQGGKPASRLRPWQLHRFDAMLGAVAARRFRLRNRAQLTGVQMTPPALGLMIVKGSLLSC